MPDVPVKLKITRDHKLVGKAPADLPECELDAVLKVPESEEEIRKRHEKMIEFLLALHSETGRKGRTKEEIDRELEEERNSWE